MGTYSSEKSPRDKHKIRVPWLKHNGAPPFFAAFTKAFHSSIVPEKPAGGPCGAPDVAPGGGGGGRATAAAAAAAAAAALAASLAATGFAAAIDPPLPGILKTETECLYFF